MYYEANKYYFLRIVSDEIYWAFIHIFNFLLQTHFICIKLSGSRVRAYAHTLTTAAVQRSGRTAVQSESGERTE